MTVTAILRYTGQKLESGYGTDRVTQRVARWNRLRVYMLADGGESVVATMPLPAGEIEEPAPLAAEMQSCTVTLTGLETAKGVCQIRISSVIPNRKG